MKIFPVDNKILILPIEKEEEKATTGIIVPKTHIEKGKVMAYGDSCKGFILLEDIVIYKISPTSEVVNIENEGTMYTLIDKEDILAILRNP